MTSMLPARRNLWLIIGLVILAVLGGISYLIYLYAISPKPTPMIKATAQPTAFDFIRTISKNKTQPGRALNIQHWQTEQGTQVYFVASPELPIVDIQMIFSAGSAQDQQHPGLAQLTNTLLLEGTREQNGDEIAAQLEQLGTHIETDTYRDMAVVQLRTLSSAEYLNPALTLMAQVISEPAFPQPAFQRNLNLMQVNLKGIQQDPDALVDRVLFNALYTNHPYQASPDGTEQSIAQITLEEVKQFYQTHYTGYNATLAIVGALTRTQAEQVATQLTKNLTPGLALNATPSAIPLTAPLRQHIEFPSTQTHIELAAIGIPYNDPHYFPLLVGNYIFGGGSFASILNKTIRQDRGLSYSVYSALVPMKAAGPFIIALETKNESAEEALTLTKNSLKQFIAQGPTPQQLQQAQEYLLASFPLKAASNDSILNYLGLIGFYHLPLNYLDTYRYNIQQVTADQIRQAFAQLINPDHLVEITLGPQTSHGS